MKTLISRRPIVPLKFFYDMKKLMKVIYINRNVFHSFKFKHSWSKFVKIYVKIVGIKHTF